jgi:hypothetical protein
MQGQKVRQKRISKKSDNATILLIGKTNKKLTRLPREGFKVGLDLLNFIRLL